MSRRVRRAVAVLAAAAATVATAVVAPSPSFAGDPQTFYVFADGDDSASCLTPHTACRTVQAALAKAGDPGDTVEVGAGTYSGDVTVAAPVRLVNYPGDSPQLTGAVDVGAAGGDVTVAGLTFTGTGAITVTANTGATTVADNVFSDVTATAIQLIGPDAAPAMPVTLDGNRGTVTPPAQTVTEDGNVAVTTGTPDTITWTDPAPAIVTASTPVHVVPNGPAQDIATLTVPDATASLSNAEYDIAITSSGTIDATEVSVSDDAGNDAHLTGDTASGDTLTGSLPFTSGSDTRSVTVATTGGAPSTITVAIGLVEYDQHQVPLNRVALASATVVDNHPPVVAGPTPTVAASGPTTITLGPPNDADQQPLTYAIASLPAEGTLGAVDGNQVSYTPGTAGDTSDRFTFTASDGLDTTTPVTALVTINTPPTAAAQTVQIPSTATSAQLTLPGSDPDAGQTLSYQVATAPVHGTVDLDPATGRATYTPTGTAPQNDSFSYTVSDGFDESPSPGTVTIVVNGRPIAQPATATWRCNSGTHSLTLQGADPDGGDITFHAAASPAHGRVHVDAGTGVADYTPDKDFVGTDSFTYTVVDSTGLRSATAAVHITIAKATSRIATTSLSPARPTSAQHPTLTVRVSSAGRVTNGVVAVDTGDGTRTARVGRNGTAALSLPSYPGGTHRLSVVFRGTSTAAASDAGSLRFTVTRVASALTVRTNPASITTRTKNAVAVITISAGTFHVSSGRVRIDEVLADGARRELAAGRPRAGSVTLRLPQFSLGQHNLSISFGGTPQVAPSSATLVERVPLH